LKKELAEIFDIGTFGRQMLRKLLIFIPLVSIIVGTTLGFAYWIQNLHYGQQNNIGWTTSFYILIQTSSTIGYGDLAPHGDDSYRLVVCLYALLMIPIWVVWVAFGSALAQSKGDMKWGHYRRLFFFFTTSVGRKTFWRLLFLSLFFWISVLVAAAIFYTLENGADCRTIGDYRTAIYYTLITSLTIGYGDYAPVSRGGRDFFLFYIVYIIILWTFVLDVVSSYVTDVVAGEPIEVPVVPQ